MEIWHLFRKPAGQWKTKQRVTCTQNKDDHQHRSVPSGGSEMQGHCVEESEMLSWKPHHPSRLTLVLF